MRPLVLTITAFGSYPGTEVIRFADLAEHGLYVVTGPTGSGKSTIFDAMVFALYGVVPGRRQAAETRSHHAPAGVAPEVVLEFEALGCRLRVRRSPAFLRPKKRGEGSTPVPTAASLEEFRADQWVPIASGAAKVRDQVGERIGLNAEQFQRVILLPQGEFERFLTDKGDDRRTLLRQLFGSAVFDRAVLHLKDQASQARQQLQQICAGVDQHRFAAHSHLAEAETLLCVEPDDPSLLDSRLAVVLAAAGRADAEREVADRAATSAEQAANTAADVARRWRDRNVRRQRRDELERSRSTMELGRQRADAASRSRPVVDAHVRSVAAAETVADAVADRSRTEHELMTALAPIGLARFTTGSFDAATVRRALADERSATQQAMLTSDEVTAVFEQLSAIKVALAGTTAAFESATQQVGDADAALVRLQQQSLALADAPQRVIAAHAARDRTTTDLDQGARAAEMAQEAKVLNDEAHAARTQYDLALQAFLASAAPRLAEQLADGWPCPVCGSIEHPAAAQHGPDGQPVSAGELDLRRADATARAELRDDLVRQLAVLHGSLGASADVTVDELAERVKVAVGEVEVAERAVAALAEVNEQTEATRLRRGEADQRQRACSDEQAVQRAGADGLAAQLGQLEAKLEAAGERGILPAVRLLGIDTADLAIGRRDLTVAHERDMLTELAVHQQREAELLIESGFETIGHALGASMPEQAHLALVASVQAWQRELDDLGVLLGEADQQLPDDEPPSSLLELQAQQAATARREATVRHTTLASCATSAALELGQIGAEAEVVAQAEQVAALSETVYQRCAGRLEPRVPLENWVLAAELDRVAEAANVHLEAMTAGRYRLQRAVQAVDGRSAGGLDLEVADAHTGTSRWTTSLSGGERFQASLALALGLADVVTSGTAATSRTLDALFVDEGFGSLDADALDQAIDALDRLRRGGRQIGVITHVDAMKAALPVGIEVRPLPGNRGSTIHQPLL
jgi:exonuclease SbcC